MSSTAPPRHYTGRLYTSPVPPRAATTRAATTLVPPRHGPPLAGPEGRPGPGIAWGGAGLRLLALDALVSLTGACL